MRINSEFKLPQWDNNLKDWEDKTLALNNIIFGVYKNFESFESYYIKFKSHPDQNVVVDQIKADTKAVLPFAFLFQSDRDFFEKYNSELIFRSISKKKNSLNSREILMILSAVISNISSVEVKFDKYIIDFFENFKDIEGFELSELKKSGLLSTTPVESFCQYTYEKGVGFELFLNNIGLRVPPNSKFYRVLYKYQILNELKSQDFKQTNELVDKLISRKAYNWSWDEKYLFGHQLINVIVANSSVDLHEDWVSLILKFAKDPRSTKNTTSFIKWWSLIDQETVSKFIRFLSHSDILIFLDAIADYAEYGRTDMKRMFKSRRKLLYGLSVQNLIKNSRLFLPTEVFKFLKQTRPNLNLDYVARLEASYGKCVIYLQVGDYHMIEGSHSCKLRIFDRFPSKNNFLEPDFRRIDYQKLTIDQERFFPYRDEFKPIALTHDINGGWKLRVINLLKDKMSVDVNNLYTEQELNRYRNVR